MEVGDSVILREASHMNNHVKLVLHSDDHVQILNGRTSISCQPENIGTTAMGLKATDPDLEHVEARIRVPDHVVRWVEVQLSHATDTVVDKIDQYTY